MDKSCASFFWTILSIISLAGISSPLAHTADLEDQREPLCRNLYSAKLEIQDDLEATKLKGCSSSACLEVFGKLKFWAAGADRLWKQYECETFGFSLSGTLGRDSYPELDVLIKEVSTNLADAFISAERLLTVENERVEKVESFLKTSITALALIYESKSLEPFTSEDTVSFSTGISKLSGNIHAAEAEILGSELADDLTAESLNAYTNIKTGIKQNAIKGSITQGGGTSSTPPQK